MISTCCFQAFSAVEVVRATRFDSLKRIGRVGDRSDPEDIEGHKCEVKGVASVEAAVRTSDIGDGNHCSL